MGSAGGSSSRSEGGELGFARRRFVERLREGGIRDGRVLNAFGAVPRHLFVPEALRDQAYRDTPLPIGQGQTISAPGVVAVMTEALNLQGHETVLEIGTGSGYQAAILSRLASRVISIERVPRLAAEARQHLDACKVWNVVVYLGDGTKGWPPEAPYEAIVVTAGGPQIPAPLVDQLAPGGRLVGPFGSRGTQELIRVTRHPDGRLSQERMGACRFVDLIGEYGWSD